MQNASTDFINAINNNSGLYSLPKVIAEWNMNVSSVVATVANAGTDVGANPDYYPIQSIVAGNRPTSGMAKPKAGRAKTTAFGAKSQFRILGPNSIYKYWESNNIAANTISQFAPHGPGYAISGVSPYVKYQTLVPCNKVQIGFETSWSKPVGMTVSITTDNVNWTPIYNDPVVGTDGTVVLYLQNNGTWSPTYNINNSLKIYGIRLDVINMDQAYANLSLIEMSARLVNDLSSDIVDVSVTKAIANSSLTQPIGDLGANVATITLDNSLGKYINSNSSSPYYNLLTKNVQATIYLGINPTSFNSAGVEYIQQGIFYIDSWGNQADYNVGVSATDFTKFLQSQTLIPTVLKNKTAGQVIQYILNMIGFDNFKYFYTDTNDYIIPYIWFQTTDMAWDMIQQVCSIAQSAVFFDEFNTMQYVSKEALLSSSLDVNVQLRANKDSNGIANIIDLDHEFTTQVNKAVVTYKTLSISVDAFGNPLTSALWQPTDTSSVTDVNGQQVTLSNNYTSGDAISIMCSFLRLDMDSSQMYVELDATYLPQWPFSGYMNIDGEIMQYSGMNYRYYPNSDLTTPAYQIVHSQDDITNINNNLTNQYLRSYNGYTGLVNLVARGLWGSQASAHNIEITGWSAYRNYMNNSSGGAYYNTLTSYPNGMSQRKSMMVLNNIGIGRPENMLMAISPAASDEYKVCGNQIYFPPSGNVYFSAGFFMNLQSDNESGMYVEVNTSTNAKSRGLKEIRLTKKQVLNGTMHETALATIAMTVATGIWYSIDVYFNATAGQYSVYVNGLEKIQVTDTTWSGGKIGNWVRGDTTAYFEYAYAANDYDPEASPETSTFMDRVTGDYVSNFVNKNLIYGIGYNSKKKLVSGAVLEFFDDFGPYAHEIREFNVQYQNAPALSASMYYTNDKFLELIKFNSNAFGAHFYFANKNRAQLGNVGLGVLQGNDVEYFGANNPVTETAQISGAVLTSSDQKTLTAVNAASVAAFGINELSFNSTWIQTDGMAQAILDWCTTYWANPVETLTSNIWIDPRMQLVDRALVNYSRKGIINEEFNVVQIQIGWSSGGITGNVSLQKALT